MSTKTHTPTRGTNHRKRSPLEAVALGSLAVAAAFFVGLQSAGDPQPASLVTAGGTLPGDLNGDAAISLEDAIAILEISQGYRSATPEEILADPNNDGQLTVDDAIRVLTTLAQQ